MENLWKFMVDHMENLWEIYGKCRKSMEIHGTSMENLWKFMVDHMENLWEIYGKCRKSMENLWKIYGKSMEIYGRSYGKPVGNLWKM